VLQQRCHFVFGVTQGERRSTASLNYRWNKNWTLHAGYRALHVDYRKGRFLYDTTMHDPLLAVTYQF
jgi:hypothetical protein